MNALSSDPPRGVPREALCPRCGSGFDCGAQAGHCDCFGLQLSDALRAELATRYRGCLCLRCLRQLQDGESPGSRVLA